jgi:two-component sensor histidine kinase
MNKKFVRKIIDFYRLFFPTDDDNNNNTKLHPITLKFNEDKLTLETEFSKYYFLKSIKQIRFAICLIIISYSIFALLDLQLIPQVKSSIWMIRFAFFLPSSIIIYMFSYSTYFKKSYQQTLTLFIIIACAGILIMTIIIPHYKSYYYNFGLILLILFGYSFIRLNFIWSVIAGWIVFLLFEITSYFLIFTPKDNFIMNSFILIIVNIIGMYISYKIELTERKEFLLRNELQNEKENKRKLEETLLEKYSKKTVELEKLNEDIMTEINERMKAEKLLDRSEVKFKTLVETLPVFIYLINDKGSILYTNRRDPNFKDTELIGNTIYNLLDVGSVGYVTESVNKVFEKIPINDIEVRGKNNELYELNFSPVKDGSRVEKILVIWNNITERIVSRERIKTALDEKEVLLEELQHRVRNNIQTISSIMKLQTRFIKDEKALEQFVRSFDRINSMALAYRIMYKSESVTEINFAEHVSNIVSYMVHSKNVDPNLIKIKNNIENVLMNINLIIPCSFILTELISNSILHAFPNGRSGEIKIKFYCTKDNNYHLSVKDNGIGIADGIDPKDHDSFGLQLVYFLTCQLHGEYEIISKMGTEFKLEFKKNIRIKTVRDVKTGPVKLF